MRGSQICLPVQTNRWKSCLPVVPNSVCVCVCVCVCVHCVAQFLLRRCQFYRKESTMKMDAIKCEKRGETMVVPTLPWLPKSVFIGDRWIDRFEQFSKKKKWVDPTQRKYGDGISIATLPFLIQFSLEVVWQSFGNQMWPRTVWNDRSLSNFRALIGVDFKNDSIAMQCLLQRCHYFPNKFPVPF